MSEEEKTGNTNMILSIVLIAAFLGGALLLDSVIQIGFSFIVPIVIIGVIGYFAYTKRDKIKKFFDKS